MSERKVLQKYYPPDFDPSVVKRRKTGGGRQKTVRLMAPFSMRCNTCGEYIYRGKKFNARKETVNDDDYYGITIYRFYIKCSHCSSEITFKTDPRNADYAAEHGASRNFEPWREKEEDKEPEPDSDEEKEESEGDIDPMKALEQRMEESQREMEVMDALQDIRTRNARFERMDTNTVLDTIAENKRKAEPKSDHAEPEENQRRGGARPQVLFQKRGSRCVGRPRYVASPERSCSRTNTSASYAHKRTKAHSEAQARSKCAGYCTENIMYYSDKECQAASMASMPDDVSTHSWSASHAST